MALYGKIQLQIDDDLWTEVKRYKLDHDYPTLNETVVELIKIGLKKGGK